VIVGGRLGLDRVSITLHLLEGCCCFGGGDDVVFLLLEYLRTYVDMYSNLCLVLES